MQTRRLGQTDLDVSLICLGTMTWGQQNTEAEAHQQLDYALTQGVNFIDTAEMYPVAPTADTQGRTEQYIGSWLAQRGNRSEVVLASKVAGRAEWLPWIRKGPTLTPEHINEAIDGSLKRLKTDYIDLYQVHWPDRNTNYFGKLGYTQKNDDWAVPIAETLEALDGLVKAGKVRHIGLSNETPWGLAEYLQLAEKNGWPRPQSIQNPYNLLNRSYEVGLAEFAHRADVGLLAYSPLAFGVLTGKYANGAKPEGARLTRWDRFDRYNNDAGRNAADRYFAIADKHGLDYSQMALAYVNSRPFVTANIIGATTMEQLKTNIESVDIELSDEVLKEIEQVQAEISNPCP